MMPASPLGLGVRLRDAQLARAEKLTYVLPLCESDLTAPSPPCITPVRRESMESLDRILVVDADGHVNEGEVDISSRLPEPWRSQGPVSLKDNQGYPRILLEGRIWGTAQGPGPSVTGPFTDKARKGRPGMIDPVARLKDMDTEGIDVAVLFGTQIALTVNGLMSGELSAALCHAVNEWLLEYCSADPRRLRAVGLIPCQAP